MNMVEQIMRWVKKLLSGETTFSETKRKWHEKDKTIYLSVTSDDTTGPEWIKRFKSKGLNDEDCTKQLLCSSDFKPTDGKRYKVVILKGRLFEPKDLAMVNIEAEAKKRNISKPNAEVACLIHEMLTYKDFEDMGLWHIITMHEPIKNIHGEQSLLGTSSYDGKYYFRAGDCNYDSNWNSNCGFAFVSPEVSSQP